jgi:hypothetical protein
MNITLKVLFINLCEMKFCGCSKPEWTDLWASGKGFNR